MKIHPVAAELFHADRWTDIMKLMAAPFQNLVDMPNKAIVKQN